MTLPGATLDPYASALSRVTDPFARGAATQALAVGAAADGLSQVEGYSFGLFQTQYGVPAADLAVSYVVTLLAAVGDEPATVDIAYADDSGNGSVRVVVPGGTLPGRSFALPLPRGRGTAILQSLQETPAPAAGVPSGPDKWTLTALLGNTARLLSVLLGERQSVAAIARDVLAQRHLMTARGGSLDLIGAALNVPRLLPAPYRLDFDDSVLALYHFDDDIAPVLDATQQHPAVSHGALRGVAGRIGSAVQIIAAGGVTIPDAPEFVIEPGGSFTIEMFADLPDLAGGVTAALAAKRSYVGRSDGAGWALIAEGTDAGSALLRFSLTDRTGTLVEAVAPAPIAVAGWFHIAGVLDGAGSVVKLFLNGAVAASASITALSGIENCADIGLGADRTGNATMSGLLDEVRLSSVARTDFSAVIGGQPYEADAATLALYHFDETDDWIDEDRGAHYALNHSALRGVPGRFAAGVRFSGDPLPAPHCPSELQFQQQLRGGLWDRTRGGAQVSFGPYARYGYRQGAIMVPGLDGATPAPVSVNDDPAIDEHARGLVTTACYGFIPDDLDATIASFTAAGRSVQEAIDYFGDWHGEPESFFAEAYQAHGITAPHQSCLPTAAVSSWVQIPGAPEFALDRHTGFTIEAIIKPDPLLDAYPRAIAASRSSGLRDGEPNADEAGWALTLGSYGGIPNSLRWTVGDRAGHLAVVLAGTNLADNAFHHVAGVIDRDAGTALLFVDGAEVGRAAIDALGIATTAGDIIIGNDPDQDAPYSGLIDEVRLSRAVRRRFNPVLGEGDERYRQRLAIFAPYRLPSSATLHRGIAALSLPAQPAGTDTVAQATQLLLSGSDSGTPGQIDFIELDSTRFCASRALRAMPARLLPGQSIAADGTMPADEVAATGVYTFHTEVLIRIDDTAGLAFADETARWMILRAARGLAALVARLQALQSTAVITVTAALDASLSPLHAQGRSLDLTLSSAPASIDLGLLGALAHEIGVDYVAYLPGNGSESFLRLSFAGGDDLDLEMPDVVAPDAATTIGVARPPLAAPASLVFRVLRCGSGNGTLSADPEGGAASRLFTGTNLGQVTIVAEYPLADGTFLSGAKTVSIAPDMLGACAIIAGDGTENISEVAASGPPDGDFREAYLDSANDSGIDFASETARQMQLPLEQALQRLAALAAAEPQSPRVTVLAAYDPTAANLQSVGRGLIAAPSDAAQLTAGRLGALAYRAGFAYVEMRRYPPSVYASVAAGQRFAIVRSPISRLWPNARISGLGELMATEFAAAGPPDPDFTVAMLQVYTAPGISFDAGVSNQVQAPLASVLTGLVAVLASAGATGDVGIAAGFDPAASDLTSVGRSVLMRHPTVTADRLAGYALAAGFAFVQHRANAPGGAAVYAASYPASGPPPNIFSDDELALGALTELAVRPELAVDGSFDWCLAPCCGAAGTLGTALPDPGSRPNSVRKIFRATASGTITVDAGFSLGDAAEPYQFVLVPVPGEGAEPQLSKDQYNDLLNFVDAYRPVGIEVVTRGIRRFVRGFRRPPDWAQLPTAATFPRYRPNR
jgi:hypothetical protein